MCIYLYARKHTRTYANIHACAHIQIYTHVHIYRKAYMKLMRKPTFCLLLSSPSLITTKVRSVCVRRWIYICIHLSTHKCVNIYMHTCMPLLDPSTGIITPSRERKRQSLKQELKAEYDAQPCLAVSGIKCGVCLGMSMDSCMCACKACTGEWSCSLIMIVSLLYIVVDPRTYTKGRHRECLYHAYEHVGNSFNYTCRHAYTCTCMF